VGQLAGEYSYQTQAGWNLTIPAIVANAIIKPEEAAKIRLEKFDAQPKAESPTPTPQLNAEDDSKLFERIQEQYNRMATDGGTSALAIKTNILAVAGDFSADKLLLNPNSYVGKPVLLNGFISRVLPAKVGNTVTLALKPFGSTAILVYVPYKVDFTVGEEVSTVGYMMGVYRDGNEALPVIAARAVLRPSQVEEFKEAK
jgi:hypothetical protein